MLKRKLTLSLFAVLVLLFTFSAGMLAASNLEEIKAYLNKEVKIQLNGELWQPKDQAGNVQYPITYNGSTYLPVRAVGEALGVEIGWDGATKTVIIGEFSTENTTQEKEDNLVTVTRVIDGDTIVVDLNGNEERVRLIGVDTPETVHPELGEQPFGREASNYTKSRLEGKEIRLEFDVQERDQYGRLLAYIWVGNEHFNATLLKEGYAVLSTWPPNVKYVDEFTKLQAQAREQGKGLWGEDNIANQYKVGNYDVDPDTGLPLQKVNINTATLEELQLIPGVGEVLAKRIIETRQNKPFDSPESLTRVNGIGEKSVQKMIPYVTVD